LRKNNILGLKSLQRSLETSSKFVLSAFPKTTGSGKKAADKAVCDVGN
jgi:hypothetical protein